MTLLRTTCAMIAGAVVLSGCSEPLDFDLRGNLGGFSTAGAARDAVRTAKRPGADARGIISYPNYQVAVARRGDTLADVADRVGTDAGALGRYNGIDPDARLRDGEVIALPARVSEPAPGTPGAIDITTLAGDAIDSAPAATTSPVQTTSLSPAPVPALPADPAPAADLGSEPIRHKVERGETAYTISRLYQVPVRSLAEWNGLGPDFAIREGQFLLIPVAAAVLPRRAAAAAAAPASVTLPGNGTPTPTPPSAAAPLPQQRVAPATTVAAPAPAVNVGTPSRAASPTRMAMPVSGRIVKDYAKGRNDGIDIAAAPGTAVRAAAAGTVAAITADANQIPIIVLRHDDNLLTVYANVDAVKVAKGQKIGRGQQLAALRSGSDAYVHFEVRQGFDSVDPNPYIR